MNTKYRQQKRNNLNSLAVFNRGKNYAFNLIRRERERERERERKERERYDVIYLTRKIIKEIVHTYHLVQGVCSYFF